MPRKKIDVDHSGSADGDALLRKAESPRWILFNLIENGENIYYK